MIRWAKTTAVVLALGSMASASWALPSPGTMRPAAQVVDADGRALDLRSINGKPILVLYEDKGSAKTNVALKRELSVLAKSGRYRSAIALVPVADVSSYDYWPARGFVKSAIRSESRKVGATIYCDWDGSFRRAAGVRSGTSSVVLFGRNARVAYAWEGAMPKPERDRLIGLLRAEVDATAQR
jgi:hypothetical protein